MLFTEKRSKNNVKYAKTEMRKTHPKRQRIPRRGPGVAELEKILKEQEGGGRGGQDISPASPPNPPSPPPPTFLFQQPHQHSPNIPSLNPPLPPPPPPPPPLPLLPPRDYANWSNLPLFPALNLIPPAPPTAADVAAAPTADAKALFPTTSRSEMNLPPNMHPDFQFSGSALNLGYYNSMVRQY